MAEILIMGAGGFGVALAVMCEKYGHKVTLWTPFEAEAQELNENREHKKLLAGIRLQDGITITTHLPNGKGIDLVIIATPSFAVRSTVHLLAGRLDTGTIVSCVSKGFEPDTLKVFSDVIEEELPSNPNVIISGPSHAEEVGRGVPTTVVAASKNRASAERLQDLLMNLDLRIYVNDDVLGVELGGALKNIIALAAGVADGLGLGDNTKAAIMTRGLSEIARLGVAMGAKTETFAGLSGMGDLIVTCTSMHSRNRRCGILVGQGHAVEEAIKMVGMTVEGYSACKSAHELAKKYHVEMPITQQTYEVFYEGKQARDGVRALMSRPKRHESEMIWLLNR